MAAAARPGPPTIDFSPPPGTDDFYKSISTRAEAAQHDAAGARHAAELARSARAHAVEAKAECEKSFPKILEAHGFEDPKKAAPPADAGPPLLGGIVQPGEEPEPVEPEPKLAHSMADPIQPVQQSG